LVISWNKQPKRRWTTLRSLLLHLSKITEIRFGGGFGEEESNRSCSGGLVEETRRTRLLGSLSKEMIRGERGLKLSKGFLFQWTGSLFFPFKTLLFRRLDSMHKNKSRSVYWLQRSTSNVLRDNIMIMVHSWRSWNLFFVVSILLQILMFCTK
jgi:hypothetical protein